MFTILICLAHTFLPNAAALVAQIEIFAAVMSVGVFGFIAYHSRRNVPAEQAASQRRFFVF
jgi:hypothetical protein